MEPFSVPIVKYQEPGGHHLSANYFNEVLNEVQVRTIFEFYLVQDRKGIEDSRGYLKGHYRKVIE